MNSGEATDRYLSWGLEGGGEQGKEEKTGKQRRGSVILMASVIRATRKRWQGFIEVVTATAADCLDKWVVLG